MHEYLRDTLTAKYQECGNCKKRTQFIRVLCGVCISKNGCDVSNDKNYY